MLGILTSGSTADMDTPAWWNMGHRPVKFVDGVFPMDAPRVDMVFYTPFFGLFGSLGGPTPKPQDWMAEHGPDLNTWIEALKAPVYPFPIDTDARRAGRACSSTRSTSGRTSRNNPVRAPGRGQRLVRELPRRLRAALRERPGVPRRRRARGHRLVHRAARHHRHRPASAWTPTTRRCSRPGPPASSAIRRRRARRTGLRPAEPRRAARRPRARLSRAAALRRLGDRAVLPQRRRCRTCGRC